jgi:serine/threonine protein kinase
MASETIIGNYAIGEVIGRGGMGVVYRGRHLKLPREVAIKSVKAHAAQDNLERLKRRFEREAYVQSQLDHPNIVKIYDYLVTAETYYIVMEFVEGSSLAQFLKHEQSPLAIARALDIFEQILAGIAYAHSFTYRDEAGLPHRGLVHRDLKPANIMITPDERAKVTDFGIVKLVGAEVTETLNRPYGTPQYVSPEQAVGDRVEQTSDVYSLGVILYEMLTGTPPFGGKTEEVPLERTQVLRAHIERRPHTPSEINKEIPLEIEAVVLRALEKKPADRYATAADFLRALRLARGRDTADITDTGRVLTHDQEANESRKSDGHTTDSASAEPRETQPIRIVKTCDICGASNTNDEKLCRHCGNDFQTSPATARIAAQKSANSQARRRGIVLFAALFVIGVLSGIVIFLWPKDNELIVVSPANSNLQTSTPSPLPLSSLVRLQPARVTVDSSFDGYTTAPLTDNITDVQRISRMRYNEGNWASAETPDPHWIEMSFNQPKRVAAVYVYWGFDRTRFVPSRRAELQILDANNEWRTISTVEPENDYDRAAFEFAPVEISRFRIFQPAQAGPRNRPFIMWMREVEVYGLEE